MKRIQHYLYIAVLLLCAQGMLAQTGVTRSGKVGSVGSGNFQFVNKSGKLVSYPRLSRSGEVLTYPPIVTTDSVPAASVTGTTATVYANVVFNGWIETIIAHGFQLSQWEDFHEIEVDQSVTPVINYTFCATPCANNTFYYTFTGLAANITYYVRSYATNSEGTRYGDTLTFTTTCIPQHESLTKSACNSYTWHHADATEEVIPTSGTYTYAHTDNNGCTQVDTLHLTILDCGDIVMGDGMPCPDMANPVDYDGNVYNTVLIGDQCWMKENLRTTHLPDGTEIPQNPSNYNSGSFQLFYANNSASTISGYGLLYNWTTAMAKTNASGSTANPSGVQGICPSGWHLPSDSEWEQLKTYVGSQYACGGNEEYVAKALADSVGWNGSSTNCDVGKNPENNNTTGFSARPACSSGGFGSVAPSLGTYAQFYSASRYENNQGYCYVIENNNKTFSKSASYGNLSVRCVANVVIASVYVPSVQTVQVSSITTSTAECDAVVVLDGGAEVTVRGVCWSTHVNPTLEDAHTSDGTGLGPFNSALTGLFDGTVYYVRAYATNSEGTVYGNEISFTTVTDDNSDGKPCSAAPLAVDIDGNYYNTVKIGAQCWMKENLRVKNYANGTSLSLTAGGLQVSGTTRRYYNPKANPEYSLVYGALYNRLAMLGGGSTSGTNPSYVQGVCPTGWHVPSDAEWEQLTDYVSSQSQYRCGDDPAKIARALTAATGWNGTGVTDVCNAGYDQGGSDLTGFSAMPAGYYSGSESEYNGVYSEFGNMARYWSCSWNHINNSTYYNNVCYITRDGSDVKWKKGSNSGDPGHYALSVRCLKDAETVFETPTQGGLPAVVTSKVESYTTITAVISAAVTNNGGAEVTRRGICYSTSPNPTEDDYIVEEENGIGAYFLSIEGLTENTQYYVRAYAENSIGISYGNELTFTTWYGYPCANSPTVLDHQGNVYHTVQIGDQCWMRENMRCTTTPTGKGNSGTNAWLPYYSKYGDKYSSSYKAYYYNANGATSDNLVQRGYLYNWAGALDTTATEEITESFVGRRGICPEGWHVPNSAEWTTLRNYVNSQVDYQCNGNNTNAKAMAYPSGWESNYTNCTPGNNQGLNNRTGFSAYPTGYLAANNILEMTDGSRKSRFWMSGTSSSEYAYIASLGHNSATFDLNSNLKKRSALSVRCLRDESGGTAAAPTVHTSSAMTDVTTNTAVAGGNVTSDGGEDVTERGVCWSMEHNPDLAGDHATSGVGTGAFTVHLMGLTEATTYYVRAYAINSLGTTYGEEVSFNTLTPIISSNPCAIPASHHAQTGTAYQGNGYDGANHGLETVVNDKITSVTDYDGNVYPAVQIGSQCWLAENLRTTRAADGTDIVNSSVSSTTTPYYYNYTDLNIALEQRGFLYNWPAALMVCPRGWHIATDEEWSVLTDYLGDHSEYICGDEPTYIAKAIAAQTAWNTNTTETCAIGNNLASNNSSGFTAIPAGLYNNGYYGDIRYAYFWTATEKVTDRSWCRNMSYNKAIIERLDSGKGCGRSVRCLRDVDCAAEVSLTPCNVVKVKSSIYGYTSGTGGIEHLKTGTTNQIDSVTDQSGNEYPVVQIGSQCWMAENLRATRYADDALSTTLTKATTPFASWNAYYCAPKNANNVADESLVPSYGYLYNSIAVLANTSNNTEKMQGICPKGWHVPSKDEMTTLLDYVATLGTEGAGAGKLAKGCQWNETTSGSNPGNYSYVDRNISGFGALPAGSAYSGYDSGGDATFWSSTLKEYDNQAAYAMSLTEVGAKHRPRYYSVRCIRDEEIVSVNPCPVSDAHPAQTGTAYQGNGYEGANHGMETVVNGKINSVTDYDGNEYPVVQIGGQCWLAENMRTTRSADGTSISIVGTNTSSATTPYIYNYTNSSIAFERRGYLYNWSAALTVCPIGWHLPSGEEWTSLTGYVSSQSEYICGNESTNIAKSFAATSGWRNSNANCAIGNGQGTNATGFSAVPAGFFNGSNFERTGDWTMFWSSLEYSNTNVWRLYLDYGQSVVFWGNSPKENGLSVRCVRDEIGGTAFVPTVHTSSTVTDVTTNTAIAGGNVISDGGEDVTERGVCWSMEHDPDVTGDHATSGVGTGAFTVHLTGLTAATTYYVRAYATNSEGTTYGEEVTFTTLTPITSSNPCAILSSHLAQMGTAYQGNGYEGANHGLETVVNDQITSVTDYDGNVYPVVQIGSQCWLAENLRTTHYGNGTAIPIGNSLSAIIAYRYDETTSSISLVQRGYLYNWSAVMRGAPSSDAVPSGVRGICPTGWHVPSDAEFTLLTDYVSSQSQFLCGNNTKYIAKALTSTTGWNSHGVNCTVGNDQSSNNATGYNVIPAGGYYSFAFGGSGQYAVLWSATEASSSTVWYRSFDYDSATVYRDAPSKDRGYSVRCLRDETTPDPEPSVNSQNSCTTPAAHPAQTGATYQGNGYNGANYGLETLTTDGKINSVTDFDGNEYPVVQIGSQCWLAENLRTTHYGNGMAILVGNSLSEAIAYRYDATTSNIPLVQRGYLYNWSAVMDGAHSSDAVPSGVQGICPTGWHVPSDAELTSLTDYVSSQSQFLCGNNTKYIAKALTSTTGWNAHGGNCTVGNGPSSNNATGYNVIPAGGYYSYFGGSSNYAVLWSATEASSSTVWYRGFDYDSATVYRDSPSKNRGYSVRCLRDETSPDLEPSVTSQYPCTIPAAHPAQMGTTYQGNGYNGANHGLETVNADGEITSVTDYDGNEYPVVQIGSQCWLAENMRCTHSPSTHTYIVDHNTPSETNYTYTGKMARWYTDQVTLNGNTVNIDSAICVALRFGLLYNWNAAVDTFNTMFNDDERSIGIEESNAVNATFSGNRQGICPIGWHVPNGAELLELESVVNGSDGSLYTGYRGSHAGQLAGGQGWNSSNIPGSPGDYDSQRDVWGFAAAPAGRYYTSFDNGCTDNDFWSSSQNEDNKSNAWGLGLANNKAGIYFNNSYYKCSGRSVRCLRD